MDIPEDLHYTEEHEWIYVEDDIAIVGITDYAQSELGDVVFVELPQLGDHVQQMEPFGTIEAVKTVADLFAPVSGEVIEVNNLLEENPQLINQDPYGDGWLIKVKIFDLSELDNLLSPKEYRRLLE
ncbi:glycine cleavage system protein GcvH [candidate division KSB1 bacterium]|nr:glycine cleavage system protein GcvH [bacterium]OQX60123.1 MAG: glycine cleavage system protein H [candidate division KSB1 bacterium 4484_219]RKY74367.1 MAG: glycine cleavage system protein GcvH [candidate division KSB1 bacterium]HDI51158.1 glycine cleavage system protein GcvH [Bacteroidota bacterium]RKY80316.1 MAG: glycine cleavage system protein GcvH [candidate division KSB1 bacterium]